jgi:hypothetical protein
MQKPIAINKFSYLHEGARSKLKRSQYLEGAGQGGARGETGPPREGAYESETASKTSQLLPAKPEVFVY